MSGNSQPVPEPILQFLSIRLRLFVVPWALPLLIPCYYIPHGSCHPNTNLPPISNRHSLLKINPLTTTRMLCCGTAGNRQKALTHGSDKA